MMGGDVTVESELGKGSTFSIELPTVVSQQPGTITVSPAVAPAIQSHACNGRILIVDDDPAVHRLLADVLQPEGLHTQFACERQRSVCRLAKEWHPSVITLDVLMRRWTDGWCFHF